MATTSKLVLLLCFARAILGGTHELVKMYQISELNDLTCTNTHILKETGITKMMCASFCQSRSNCVGAFYNPGTSSCTGCSTIDVALDHDAGTVFISGKHIACPYIWTKYIHSCYVWPAVHLDVTRAEEYCNEIGGRLVHIETEREMNFLKSYTNSRRWVGITDVGTEGRWVFVGTNTPATFLPWAGGEPNNNREGNCALMWEDGGFLLADETCSKSFRFICELS